MTSEQLLNTLGDGMVAANNAIKDLQADNASLKSELGELKKTVKEINAENEISPDMKDYIEDRKKNAERRKQ